MLQLKKKLIFRLLSFTLTLALSLEPTVPIYASTNEPASATLPAADQNFVPVESAEPPAPETPAEEDTFLLPSPLAPVDPFSSNRALSIQSIADAHNLNPEEGEGEILIYPETRQCDEQTPVLCTMQYQIFWTNEASEPIRTAEFTKAGQYLRDVATETKGEANPSPPDILTPELPPPPLAGPAIPSVESNETPPPPFFGPEVDPFLLSP